jgi:hypothetical protein
LRILSAEDDEFVCTRGHKCSYVDGDYFENDMGEVMD